MYNENHGCGRQHNAEGACHGHGGGCMGHGHHRRPEDYEKMSTDDKLAANLRDLSHTMRHILGGKGGQRRILMILRDRGGITQRELTERIDVRPGTASEVIGKLEDAGLIRRTVNEEDRRTANIELTEEGAKLAEEEAARKQERRRELFSCLSDEEKSALLTLTEKLNADWRSRREGHCGKGRCHGHEAAAGENGEN